MIRLIKMKSLRDIAEAKASIKRSEQQLEDIKARSTEADQIVWRLHLREEENHFGESLMLAMTRKA